MPIEARDAPRLAFADVAKGLGILLVLAGHAITTCAAPWWNLQKVILSFHMPLFYFLSGLFFKAGKNGSGRFGFGGRWISAYCYYCGFGLFLLPIYRSWVPADWADAGRKFYSLAVHGSPWINGPLWFLVSLAGVSAVFAVFHRASGGFRTVVSRIGFLLACLCGTLVADRLPGSFRTTWSPFMLATVPCGCLFYACGSMSKNAIVRISKRVSDVPFSAAALATAGFAVVAALATGGPRVFVLAASIGSWRFFPAAFLGIASSLLLSSAVPIRCARPLAWIGRHSLAFFALDHPVRAWIYKIVYHSFGLFGLKPADRLLVFFLILLSLQIVALSLAVRPAERGLAKFRSFLAGRMPRVRGGGGTPATSAP